MVAEKNPNRGRIHLPLSPGVFIFPPVATKLVAEVAEQKMNFTKLPVEKKVCLSASSSPPGSQNLEN